MIEDQATEKQISYLQSLLEKKRADVADRRVLTDDMVIEAIDRIQLGNLRRKEASTLIDIFKPGPLGLTNALVLTRMLRDFENLLAGTQAAKVGGKVKPEKRYDFFSALSGIPAGTVADN